MESAEEIESPTNAKEKGDDLKERVETVEETVSPKSNKDKNVDNLKENSEDKVGYIVSHEFPAQGGRRLKRKNQ